MGHPVFSLASSLHVADDTGGEFAGADFGGAGGLAFEVVGYELLLDGFFHG